MIGGAFRKSIPTYVSGLPRPTDAERADFARAWVDRGARRVKLSLGYGVREDLATFDAVATACPELSIAIDTHWVYTFTQAERLGRGLDDRGACSLRLHSHQRICTVTHG